MAAEPKELIHEVAMLSLVFELLQAVLIFGLFNKTLSFSKFGFLFGKVC
jgi:hypothetical protein